MLTLYSVVMRPLTNLSTSSKAIGNVNQYFGLFGILCVRIYMPCLYLMNKIDTITIEELNLLARVPHYVPICAGKEWNFDDLLETMWKYLDMFRMYVVALFMLVHRYTKPKGQ